MNTITVSSKVPLLDAMSQAMVSPKSRTAGRYTAAGRVMPRVRIATPLPTRSTLRATPRWEMLYDRYAETFIHGALLLAAAGGLAWLGYVTLSLLLAWEGFVTGLQRVLT